MTEEKREKFDEFNDYVDSLMKNIINEKIERRLIEVGRINGYIKVVRCKDCKYCMKADRYELWCRRHGSPPRITTADDCCSLGERKEVETNDNSLS